MTAVGLKNWTLSINLGKMKNGGHTIEARAFDGSLYSDTASTTFIVSNPEPKATMEAFPWYIALIIVIAIFGAMIIIFRRKNRIEEMERKDGK